MPYSPVAQDGFEFSHDRFLTHPSRAEREEPHFLRNMFLPKLTPEANKRLRDHGNFVSDQLKHYGVDYDKEKLTGNGTNLLKKLLKEGKLEKVPDHIKKLKSQLAVQWYDQLTLEEMADTHKEQLIQKYFLDPLGQPDRTKTIDVLTVPLPHGSSYRTGKLIAAADRVNGLHNVRRGDSLYIGWDQAAVEDTAKGHEGRVEQEKENRDQERNSMNTAYLRKARRRNRGQNWSPIGSYIIDCDAIEGQWSEYASYEMTLDICKSNAQGFFEASFDFGVLNGMMILGDQEEALDKYCAQLDRKDMSDSSEYSNDDDDDDDDDDGDRPIVGSKRKAAYNNDTPSKKAKPRITQSKTMFLKWKGIETGEGEILYEAEDGCITFSDPEYSRFTGEMDMSFVGRNVSFLARKVSVSVGGGGSWSDYSESKHERARVSRWR
ncbi:hypothetical protein F4781DRAFT_384241 [Annulohypoxylon bovei var. microspora]|nr:hypothetical protein F4781DRAFT_384241 [Annulohypoxylon bovei var. microspora]